MGDNFPDPDQILRGSGQEKAKIIAAEGIARFEQRRDDRDDLVRRAVFEFDYGQPAVCRRSRGRNQQTEKQRANQDGKFRQTQVHGRTPYPLCLKRALPVDVRESRILTP